MPLITTVIDDKSPLIQYDATWLPGSAWTDNLASNYYLGTFTTNNVTGGAVTINFNATNFWIYGANRPNHGSYTVEVDSTSYSGYNGAGNNLFQQSLFNLTVSQGMHSVKLTNTASNSDFVDIDMIVWQSEVGAAGDQLLREMIQDTDPRFQYQEPAWTTASPSSNFNFNLFSNGTGHVTQTYNASVTFTFTGMQDLPFVAVLTLTDFLGEAVTLFGTSGPSNGPYTAQLDNGQTTAYNATTAYPTNYEVALYHADNLGPGSHQIVLTNLPSASGQSLGIDYAQLWTIANATSGSPGAPTSNTSIPQNTLSSGAIAGIAVAVAAALLAAGAAFFFYRRWKVAVVAQNDLYRAFSTQQRPPETSLAAGFSSSLETRRNSNLMRNDALSQTSSGRLYQPVNNHVEQYSDTTPVVSGPRDSRSVFEAVSSPTQSSMEEGFGRRPLPEAPGGGFPLSVELPKLADLHRGASIMSADRNSLATNTLPPPNYMQATGSGSAHES